jgi:hypothetical protein
MLLKKLPAAAIVLAVALAACATPTPYGPTDGRGYGYREQRIEADRYVVTFSGNSATSANDVSDLALRRAADLALSQGFDWFEVVSRSDDVSSGRGGGSGLSVGIGGVSGGGNTSVGTSVGMSFPLGGGSGGAATTSLEVRMGRGERPDRATVYDAREVSNNLAAAAATAS